jgi:enoyl-CoA hydratase
VDAASPDAPVLVTDDGAVRTIMINRPQARNAVNMAVAAGIAAALDELDRRADLAVGVLGGTGGSFCAGMDLKAFASGELPIVPGHGFAGIVERASAKPLVAAVEGFALAGGLEIVLACDLIVASEDAVFGLPEAKRGLVAAGGGLVRLPRRIPYHQAMELALTGATISAARAMELGLANRLARPGEALSVAAELALEVAANGPLAVVVSKRVIQDSLSWPPEETFARQAALVDPVFSSKDAIEGARAFAEKRAPVWSGQ